MCKKSKETILTEFFDVLNNAKLEEDIHRFLSNNDVILKYMGYDCKY